VGFVQDTVTVSAIYFVKTFSSCTSVSLVDFHSIYPHIKRKWLRQMVCVENGKTNQLWVILFADSEYRFVREA
jgi:hypothetical protein